LPQTNEDQGEFMVDQAMDLEVILDQVVGREVMVDQVMDLEVMLDQVVGREVMVDQAVDSVVSAMDLLDLVVGPKVGSVVHPPHSVEKDNIKDREI